MHYEKCLHFYFYYLFVRNENTFNMYTFFENKIQNVLKFKTNKFLTLQSHHSITLIIKLHILY